MSVLMAFVALKASCGRSKDIDETTLYLAYKTSTVINRWRRGLFTDSPRVTFSRPWRRICSISGCFVDWNRKTTLVPKS